MIFTRVGDWNTEIRRGVGVRDNAKNTWFNLMSKWSRCVGRKANWSFGGMFGLWSSRQSLPELEAKRREGVFGDRVTESKGDL